MTKFTILGILSVQVSDIKYNYNIVQPSSLLVPEFFSWLQMGTPNPLSSYTPFFPFLDNQKSMFCFYGFAYSEYLI